MNIDQMKRDLAAKRDAASAKLAATTKTANDEDRTMTDAERADVQAAFDDAVKLKTAIERAESDAALGRAIEGLVPATAGEAGVRGLQRRDGAHASTTAPALLSLGAQFVASDAFQFFKAGLHRTSAAWRSPSAELQWDRGFYAATLTEDPASGGKLIVPDYRPGLLPLSFRRPVVADLIAPGTTDSNLITYMKETSFINAADTVLEGGVKPESTLTFDAVSDPVRKIAHWLPATEEMLEDAPQIRSYIDSRLRLGIELTEEDQLLNGTAVAPDIIGLRNRAGLAPDVVRGTDSVVDAIFKQIMAIASTSYLMPDGVVMNPADWAKVQLLKSTTGEYLGGGPFVSAASPTLWGLAVVVTPVIEAGVAFVGAYRQASQIFRKGGVRVEASNSHQDFFVKNLVAIRAEERLALAVYRPGAFGEVVGLNAA